MRFEIPLPPSTNNLFVNTSRGRKPTSRYNAWREEAGGEVMRQRVGQKLPGPPYEIDVWCYFGDHKRRDADNYNKAPQDLLASVLHFEDDLVIDAGQHKRYDGERPRCVVYLYHSYKIQEPDPDLTHKIRGLLEEIPEGRGFDEDLLRRLSEDLLRKED